MSSGSSTMRPLQSILLHTARAMALVGQDKQRVPSLLPVGAACPLK